MISPVSQGLSDAGSTCPGFDRFPRTRYQGSKWKLANWIVEREIPLDSIITDRFTLDKAEEAFKLFGGGTTGKVVINWD